MKKFLNRPKPIYAESLRSYLKRLAASNFISPDTLLRALDLPQANQLTPVYLAKRYEKYAPTITLIESATRLEPGALLSKIPTPNANNKYCWYGVNMPLIHLRGNPAVCEHCLACDNVEKNAWFMRAYIFCPVHNTALVPVDPFHELSDKSISNSLEEVFCNSTGNANQIEFLNNQITQITNLLPSLKTTTNYIPMSRRHSLANHKAMTQTQLFSH
ncbi:hypothetical protein A3740_13635 [Oleiphilus sp. HI0068]|nr:hypothetical protein A3741_01625 [Oleiphilus sp. HI0069]KZY76111.1 hypothetical protein A3740_13635 [Oleiphilus sp. HI0068]KZZ32040.1 hypothetical protein A3755_01520 [Oleiphilus sp. HI0085]